MLNVNKSIDKILSYKFSIENDLSFKFLIYGILSLSFLLLLRVQFPEIKLLQLLPGFYLFLVFFGCCFLLFFSNFFINYIYKNELKLESYFKIINYFYSILVQKFFLSFFFLSLTLSLSIFIPISLESLINSSSENLESLASFIELIIIGLLLILLLILFFEFPFLIKFFFTTEDFVFVLTKKYKVILLFIFVISGILTPTIDIETQLLVEFISLIIYILVIILFQKLTRIKLGYFSSLIF